MATHDGRIRSIKDGVAAAPDLFYAQLMPDMHREGRKWKARCPIHPDQNASLLVDTQGRWHCFGCGKHGDALDLLTAVTGCGLPAAVERASDMLAIRPELPEQSRCRREAAVVNRSSYQVVDADGRVVGSHMRTDYADGTKRMWWKPKGLHAADLPLYGLPTLLAADPSAQVVVTEGEKACDALIRAGQTAVGTYGAAVLPSDDSLAPLLNRRVLLWADNDAAGHTHMRAISERLAYLGTPTLMVNWTDAPERGDAADFVAQHDPVDLAHLLAQSVPAASATAQPAEVERKTVEPLAWASAAELCRQTAQTQWLWQPWIPLGHITVLAGEPGVGKSAVSLHFAACVSAGCPWPDGTVTPLSGRAPVLIADSEGAQAIWANRIRDWGLDPSRIFFPGSDAMGRLILTDERMLAAVRARVEQSHPRLLIIDSLRTALPGAIDENSSAVGSLLAPWADLCRDTGISIVIVHHFGKRRRDEIAGPTTGRVRGSSAIVATARSVLAVDRSELEDGALRLLCLKSNLAELPGPLDFQIGPTGVEWLGASPAIPTKTTQVSKAEAYLREQLRDGPRLGSDLLEEGQRAELTRDSIFRARRSLRIVSVSDANDATHRRQLWMLPAHQGR